MKPYQHGVKMLIESSATNCGEPAVTKPNDGEKLRTPIAAIRAKCKDCTCGSLAEIRACHLDQCALHPYRHGRRPTRNDA